MGKLTQAEKQRRAGVRALAEDVLSHWALIDEPTRAKLRRALLAPKRKKRGKGAK